MSRPSAADMYRRYSESNASAQSREPRNARDAYARSRQAAEDRLSRPPRPGQQQRREPTGPSEQEMNDYGAIGQPFIEGDYPMYEANIKEMERELELQEKRDAEQLREFQEKAQTEVQARLARLDETMAQSLERQMMDMESRYGQHSNTRIKTKSTDVLRINKILREIGRGLGPDWRPVFRIMVKNVPLEEVEKQLKKIERQKPFIQAYKALTVARELNGEDFEIFRLVDALKDCDKYDLAERTLDILDSEGDELFTLGTFGRPIVSGSYDVDLEGDEGKANGHDAAAAATNGQQNDGGADYQERKAKSLRTPNYVEGPLADRKLLHLSKKMGEKWEQLAALLNVPEEDINDIKESDADQNQTNFKLIWGWREAVMDNSGEDEAVSQLKAAFGQMGRQDLVAMLEE